MWLARGRYVVSKEGIVLSIWLVIVASTCGWYVVSWYVVGREGNIL